MKRTKNRIAALLSAIGVFMFLGGILAVCVNLIRWSMEIGFISYRPFSVVGIGALLVLMSIEMWDKETYEQNKEPRPDKTKGFQEILKEAQKRQQELQEKRREANILTPTSITTQREYYDSLRLDPYTEEEFQAWAETHIHWCGVCDSYNEDPCICYAR